MQDSSSQLNSTARQPWIDMMRSFCMIAILWFHTEMYYAGTDVTPYGFYVENVLAGFFFISGYLFYRPNGFDPKRKIRSVFSNILVPYIIFTTLIALPKALAHGDITLFSSLSSLLSPLSSILTGHASWFVAALIIAELLFSLILWITKGKHSYIIPIIILAVIASFIIGNLEYSSKYYFTHNFWHINEALLAIGFLYTGYLCNEFKTFIHRFNTPLFISLLLVLLIILKVLEYNNGWKMVMGPIAVTNYPVFLIDCLTGCLLLSFLFQRFVSLKWIEWTGSHSLVYYFICGGVPLLTAKVMNIVGFQYNNHYWQVIIVFIFVYIISTIITWFIYRYLPFMVSLRNWNFNPFLSTIRHFFVLIAGPLVYQFPLFVISFILLVPGTTKFAIFYNSYCQNIQYIQYYSLAFLVSYILTTLTHITKSRIVKCSSYIFVVSLFILHIYLWIAFKRLISPVLAIVLLETNAHEASEFISTYIMNSTGLLMFIVLIAIILLIIVSERIRIKLSLWLQRSIKPLIIGIITFLIMVFGIISLRVYITLFMCKTSEDLEKWSLEVADVVPMDNFSALLYASFGPVTAHEELQQAINATSNALLKDTPKHDGEPLKVVLVIGESHIKKHSHLYGYHLDTSPCMDKELSADRLFVFQNIVSPYNLTTMAVKNLLCTNSITDGEKWYNTPFFPAIFKKSGYEVYSWDNQRTMDEDRVFTFSLNSFLYNPYIKSVAYDAINEKCFEYDGQLINNFFSSAPLKGSHQLYIFHLMGQHFNPEKRYPLEKKYNYFNADSIPIKLKGITREQRQTIAYYDNATRYVDSLLGIITDSLKNSNAVMIYLSDHGEEVYDYRLSSGRTSEDDISKTMAQYQNDIPFLVWCSDTYKKNNPDIINSLRKSINNPTTSDNTCHLLFRLGKIKTYFYRPERDVSSPKFKKYKRLIYNNINYDNLK